MMKKKGYKMGGKMKSKGMKLGGKTKKMMNGGRGMRSKMMSKGGAKPKMSLAQIRSAANKKGYKLTKATQWHIFIAMCHILNVG